MLASQLAQEFVFIHTVLKGFATVDEDNRNFVGKLTAKTVICIYINFAPMKATAALELSEFLLHDLAKVASAAGIHNDVTRRRHGTKSVTILGRPSN